MQKLAPPPTSHQQMPKRSLSLVQFVARLSAFLVVQAVISSCFFIPYLLKYEQAVNQSYPAATIDKHGLLDRQAQPRLILIGGSSVAFGINSPYLKEKLGYQPVNMGIQAGLGGEFMLNEVKPSLRSGDVVVISLEYETFIGFPPDAKSVFDNLEAQKQNAQFLPLSYISVLLDQGLIQLGSFFRRSTILLTTGKLERLPYYDRAGFNEFGDMVAHYSLPNDTKKLAGEARYYRFKPDQIQRMIHALNDFHQYCQSKGVQVFYIAPPLMPTLLTMNQAEIAKLETALAQSLTFPILARSTEVASEDQNYFDTRYHLNKTGMQQRTEFLAAKLLPFLGRKN
jgi:hypothetical protein